MTDEALHRRLAELAQARVATRAPLGESLDALRQQAATQFEAAGLPLRRHEAWRYTDLRSLDKLLGDGQVSDGARAAAAPELSASPSDPLGSELTKLLASFGASTTLVFVDGRFSPGPSTLPAARGIGALSSDPSGAPGSTLGHVADLKDRPLTALNTAAFEDAACIRVSADTELEGPIVVVHVATGRTPLASPRVVVDLDARSRARLIEIHTGFGGVAGLGGVVVNAVTEGRLAEGARLDLVHVQAQPESNVHFAELAIRQERDSELRIHSLALGAALARVEIRDELLGEGAHGHLYGLYLGRRSQVLDHYVTVDHAAPHTTSDELFKGILTGRSKGIFCGCIRVRPHAQKIDATQTNRALLLTDSAALHTRPQLEIYADDVRCSHGASIGQLDLDALFYLRARGIGEQQARALLTQAFVEDILDSLALAPLENYVRAQLRVIES